jgi:hypothetical protein
MEPATCPLFWLIENIHLYLTGFLSCINQEKTRKNSHKCGEMRWWPQAFTISALIMIGAYAKYSIY